jgi:predicted transcriptional regulator
VLVTAATTIRLPDETRRRLDTYCEQTGAVRNRVVVLALKSFLGEEGVPALPVARRFEEPDEGEIERLADVARGAIEAHRGR